MILKIPQILQQADSTCGPTCVRAACEYLGVKYPDLSKRLHCTADEGVEPRTIGAWLRGEKIFLVADGSMTVEDLRHFANVGAPVICLLNGHYVTSAGVSRGRVHFHDPESGMASLPVNSWLSRWRCGSCLGVDYVQWSIVIQLA